MARCTLIAAVPAPPRAPMLDIREREMNDPLARASKCIVTSPGSAEGVRAPHCSVSCADPPPPTPLCINLTEQLRIAGNVRASFASRLLCPRCSLAEAGLCTRLAATDRPCAPACPLPVLMIMPSSMHLPYIHENTAQQMVCSAGLDLPPPKNFWRLLVKLLQV